MLKRAYKIVVNLSINDLFFGALASACFIYALFIALRYAHQPPLDMYSFRQTQTALTAYWLQKDGFHFAYETPVAGAPWSIPFEFPIYEYMVALIAQYTPISLDSVGRLLSFIFLALCILPVRTLSRDLELPRATCPLFIALLFSSPLYLYWGRTFMIETAAVFFAVAAISFYVKIILGIASNKHRILFVVFITLGILQKATTGLPVLAVLATFYGLAHLKESKSLKGLFISKKLPLAFVYFMIPLMIGAGWTLYTDRIKSLNQIGVKLTSHALAGWNWGTVSQRLSLDLYQGVIWQRVFEQNLSGILGVACLLAALGTKAEKTSKITILLALVMGLLPFFLFTNLHIVHTYYQTANVIFLIFALALSLSLIGKNYAFNRSAVPLLLGLFLLTNYMFFSDNFLDKIKEKFTFENSRDYAVGTVLRNVVPENQSFVAFGNDWSSSFAYIAQRKSFGVAAFFDHYNDAARHPEDFIPEADLGAVVMCPPVTAPTLHDLMQWTQQNRAWKIGETHECFIATPETPLAAAPSMAADTTCDGAIESANTEQKDGHTFLVVNGWTTISRSPETIPYKTYITLSHNGGSSYLEALAVDQGGIHSPKNKRQFIQNIQSGFSRVIDADKMTGDYTIGVIRLNQGKWENCFFHKDVSLKAPIHE